MRSPGGFFIFLFFCLASFSTTAATSPVKEYCAQTWHDFSDSIQERQHKMYFYNQGGLFNGGTCWWHSRLQRSAHYLAVFFPNRRRPSVYEAKQLLYKLRKNSDIVEIGGYANWNSFSRDFENEIQSMLNAWQKVDGFVNQDWLLGIKSLSYLKNIQAKQMDYLYNQVHNKGLITYTMLQVKGIVSHSYLVTKMEKEPYGYSLTIIDSNSPNSNSRIRYDKKKNILYDNYDGLLHIQRQSDLQKIQVNAAVYCMVHNETSKLKALNLNELKTPNRYYELFEKMNEMSLNDFIRMTANPSPL